MMENHSRNIADSEPHKVLQHMVSELRTHDQPSISLG